MFAGMFTLAGGSSACGRCASCPLFLLLVVVNSHPPRTLSALTKTKKPKIHRATLHLNLGSEGGQREVQHGDDLVVLAARTLLRLCRLYEGKGRSSRPRRYSPQEKLISEPPPHNAHIFFWFGWRFAAGPL